MAIFNSYVKLPEGRCQIIQGKTSPSSQLRNMMTYDTRSHGQAALAAWTKGFSSASSWPQDFLVNWQCVKTLYPFCSHQNSWDSWMFIPLKIVSIGIDPYPIPVHGNQRKPVQYAWMRMIPANGAGVWQLAQQSGSDTSEFKSRVTETQFGCLKIG